jgi:hypothetical protein
MVIEPIEAETAESSLASDYFFPEMVRLARREARDILDGLTFDEPGAMECGEDEGETGAWSSPGWREASVEYHKQRGDSVAAVSYAPDDLARLRRLLDRNVSIERALHALNDPCNRPTPQATIEAIMHCVRERGLAALNLERLSRCDAAAIAQIDRRLTKESV